MRQYIGARYVPKFFNNNGSTEWVSGIAYEPLTIVTYLGNSFTSRKPVPAGIGNPASNNEYWANTGIFNAQVEAINERIDDLEESTAENLAQAKTDVASENANVYLIITDSYGNTFPTEGVEHAWSYYFQERTRSTVYAYNRGGSGFIGTLNRTFMQVLEDAISGMTTEQKESVTHIIVGGGCNDIGAEATPLDQAITEFCTACRTNYPNAKVYIACIGDVISNLTQHRLRWQSVVPIYSKNGSSIYLSDSEKIMLNKSYYQDDGIHPNTAGMTNIGYGIANIILGHGYNMSATYQGALTSDFASHNLTENVYSDGENIWLELNGGITTPNGIPSGNTTIGTLTDNIINASQSSSFAFFGCEYMISTPNGRQFVTLPTTINGKNLILATGIAFADATSITINRKMINLPAGLN